MLELFKAPEINSKIAEMPATAMINMYRSENEVFLKRLLQRMNVTQLSRVLPADTGIYIHLTCQNLNLSKKLKLLLQQVLL